MSLLEAQLDENEQEEKRVDVAEVIGKLDKILNTGCAIESKTNITHKNRIGMMRAITYNKYLQVNYGFRIDLLDLLILENTRWITSINGKGRDEIIRAIEALQLKIQTSGSLDLGDRLLGVRG